MNQTQTSHKKRAPNCFLFYRKEMIQYKQKNITMSEYSKIISIMWDNLPEEKKFSYKRRAELNDYNLRNNIISAQNQFMSVLDLN